MLKGNIDLTYDPTSIPNTIRPESESIQIGVSINYFVSGPLVRLTQPFLKTWIVPIELSVGAIPDWLTISIRPDVVYSMVKLTKSNSPENVSVSVQVSPDAPAFQKQEFDIFANASSRDGPLGLFKVIQESTNSISIGIIPGYYANFKYNHQSFFEIKVNETLTVPISITSFANARSKIWFEVIDRPQNWSVSIPSEIFIGTEALGEDSEEIVDLVIKHNPVTGLINEVVQFTIRVTTLAAGHSEVGFDNSTTLQVTVRIRGGALEFGEESNNSDYSLLYIGVVVAIIIFVLYFVFFKIIRRV